MKTFFSWAPALFFSFLLLGASCSPRQRLELGRKTLAFSLPDDMKNLDPALSYDSVAMDVIPLVLESLYQYSYTKSPLELEPLLAEKMPEISSDQKTYTVKIKKGVFWHDADFFPGDKGRELVADDFIFAWKRLALPELQSPSTWIFNDKVLGWNRFSSFLANSKTRNAALDEAVEGFEAPDRHTLRIRLVKPYPQFLHILAMAYTAPLPREVFQKYGTFALNDRIIGTGPYRFREYVRGTRLVLEKNPRFRGEKYPSSGDDSARSAGLLADAGQNLPFADQITFHIFKEDQPRWLTFTKGLLDVSGIPKDNFSSVVDHGELREEMAGKGIQFMKLEQARQLAESEEYHRTLIEANFEAILLHDDGVVVIIGSGAGGGTPGCSIGSRRDLWLYQAFLVRVEGELRDRVQAGAAVVADLETVESAPRLAGRLHILDAAALAHEGHHGALHLGHNPLGALMVLAGFLLVHLTQHTLVGHFHFGEETHKDEFVHAHKSFSVLVGLMIHTFFDGIAIASGFRARRSSLFARSRSSPRPATARATSPCSWRRPPASPSSPETPWVRIPPGSPPATSPPTMT